MPKGYNALNDMQVNHLESGICPKHGYWLTSEQCNCYPKETALMFAAEQTKNTDWEADADRLHELLHPADEVKSQYECENCQQGGRPAHLYKDGFQYCTCCNGNWQDCETCYRLSQLPKNVTTSKTWLERNTHGSPEEREQARKNAKALNKGVDWSKVPEVIQPNEINRNRFIEGTDWDE